MATAGEGNSKAVRKDAYQDRKDQRKKELFFFPHPS
ncbi:hypothetical protein QG37_01918 [Candidozyma auris]|uniref:Uncharacterized protein n=1 Tax=Candidozyma auris TaxID=498019 RepID=A0A0L0P4A4_CANAR|nr:hypothetical protein QG37_01918 [[Candida] auris]